MIYRQRRKVSQLRLGHRSRHPAQKEDQYAPSYSQSSDASMQGEDQQHNNVQTLSHHDNYMPDVMTLHSLGVTATAVDQQQMMPGLHNQQPYTHSHHKSSYAHQGRPTADHQHGWQNQMSHHQRTPYTNNNARPAHRYPNNRHFSTAVRTANEHISSAVFTEPQRLHKLLAHAGLGSRRMMEQLIFEGRISVNARPAEIGQKVGPDDVVRINGQVVKFDFRLDRPRILLYYKPEGEIVSRDDPANRNTVFARLPKLVGARWVSVGRLDYNTSGLLLFTTSGDLANRLMHPRFEVEREYSVRVRGALTQEQIRSLTDGVVLDDGPAAFLSLVDAHPDAEYLKDGNFQLHEPCNRWYRVVISEGRNREVRKMFEAVGTQVTRLVRIRYSDIFLPQSLRRGQWRELDPRQVSRFVDRIYRTVPPVEEGEDRGSSPDATEQEYTAHPKLESVAENSSSRHPLQRRRWLGMRRRSLNPQS